MFASNVGGLDRKLRIIVGLVAIAFAIFGPADIAWKWVGYFGAVPLLTGLIGWCPPYSLLGINTCKVKQ